MEEDRLTAIETKLAYLEDFLAKIQEVTVELGAEIRQLKGESSRVNGRLTEILDSLGDVPNVRPPHY